MTRDTTKEQWEKEGEEKFGPDKMHWQFVCPVCGFVARPLDYQEAGAPEGAVAFSCIGRWIKGSRDAFGGTGPGPCNYTGGGLFRLNPVKVDDAYNVFEFAGADD